MTPVTHLRPLRIVEPTIIVRDRAQAEADRTLRLVLLLSWLVGVGCGGLGLYALQELAWVWR